MSSLVVLEQMVMIFILILTGFVLYKKNRISDSASKDLSALVVNVCSPGLIIVSMFNDLSQIPRENVIFVGIIGIIFYLFLIFFGYFLVWVRVWVRKALLKQVFYKIFSWQRGSASNFRCSKIEPHKQRKGIIGLIFRFKTLSSKF